MKKKFTWSKINEDYYAYYGEEELGFIEYYNKWKKWIWNQSPYIVMSLSCLKEVVKKLDKLEKIKNRPYTK